MGRSYTPKYVVEIRSATPPGCKGGFNLTPMEWREKSHCGFRGFGKPTDENLERYVMDFAKSFEMGGANESISIDMGYVPYPTSAIIRENKLNGRVLASWKAGVFQVFQ